MSLAILGFAACHADEFATLKIAPAWRKATRNMILSAEALERARPNGDFTGAVIGLILHSASGELDTSADFLTTLDQQKMARPVLFQNSLHNATTGFLSIAFGITGPTMTVSAGSEEAVFLAESWLADGACDFCWIVSCEVHHKLAVMAEQDLAEGAAAVLLGRDLQAMQVATHAGSASKRRLSRFDCARAELRPEKLRASPLVSFEKDFLCQWVAALAASSGPTERVFRAASGHDVTAAWT